MSNSIPIELLRSILRYDPETGELFWTERPLELFAFKKMGEHWNRRFAGTPALGTKNKKGYLHGCIFHEDYGAHRVAFALHHGYWPDKVDHDDGNRANNRINNIFDATPLENSRNQKIPSHNTSGTIGVSWHKPSSKWRANIKVHGKLLTIGAYGDKENAIAARKAAENQYGFHQNHGRIG